MTLSSNSTTTSSTKTHSKSLDNSSLRTTVSVLELFDNNPRSVISQMAGNISRQPDESKSSFYGFKKSANSGITYRIVPEGGIPEFQETPQAMRTRKQAQKTFIDLQHKRLSQEEEKLTGTGNLIAHFKIKKRNSELALVISQLKQQG